MKKTVYYIIVLFVSTTLLYLPSCKSPKGVGTVEVRGIKSHQDFFDSMLEQSFRYNTLSARLNAEITTSGNTLSSRVDLKMVRDSVFQLSVVPLLGIEIARLEFSTDSVKVIDRMNKRYAAEAYADMKGEMPIDFNFYNLQALFTNYLFLPGEQEIQAKQYNRFKLEQEGSRAKITTKDALDLLYTFMADGEEKLLSLQIADESKESGLQWNYKDFKIVGTQPFPMLMDAQMVLDNTVVGKTVLSFSRVDLDVPVNMNFSIPANYERITFAQILRSLSNK